MSFNSYPNWTPLGSYLEGLDRQTERQKAIMRSSLETTETTISQDAPVIMQDSRLYTVSDTLTVNPASHA